MNILLMTGPLYPKAGNNANLLSKLLPLLGKQNTLQLLSSVRSTGLSSLPDRYGGIPILWVQDDRQDFRRRIVYPAIAAVNDRSGYSDYLAARLIYDAGKAVCAKQPFDAVISTMEPFPSSDASTRIKSAKKILYLMDPPASISGGNSTQYRDRRLKAILSAQDLILTTPFIRSALWEHGYKNINDKIQTVGFPLVGQAIGSSGPSDDRKIRLLFCGWLYSDIRSPKYFLDLVSRLDERFVVTFMGRECSKLKKRFPIKTKAELITLAQQPYETALQAMADADILINIGNSVPVHMPSKTLEYINTGKPIVNFYKMDDCPTLYYTKRYPLCLNLSEQDSDLDAAAARFTEFCESNKGRTVDRQYIQQEYADCTPEFIADQLLRALE